ncbi:MAG: stage V sporulation protein D [Bacilli bacterium]|nr:stage V sporulation protein D [Bacilli bacterium]
MFQDNFKNRVLVIFMVVILLFVLIIGRIFYIQVIKYDELNELANDLWSRNLPITADRGLITDRNGKILADNITTTSLVVVPNQIVDKEKVAKDLAEILNVSYDEMYKHLTKKTSIERIHPEGRQLSYEIADKINNLNYDGVYLLKESKRYYPYKTLLSHVIGYVGIDNQGLSGIEAYYDSYLTGANGSIKYYSDGKGARIEKASVYEPSQSGMTLALTIDLDIQLAVEKELDNVVSKYNPEQALIVVADPKTGEILAMSSRPNFDSNNYQNYNLETINRNLPIFNTYEPGSTFKVITLAASIEEKTINLFEDRFHDAGSIKVDGAKIKCWKSGGHGSQSYLQVVQNSCNPGFVVMGQKLGKERLMNYVKKFGFGEKTGIDLSGEEDGILFALDKMGPVETATTAFGQGVSVTPIQQVMGVSAAVNGGKLYQPYLLKSISSGDTKQVIQVNEPILKRQVISEETSKLVRYTLESVVSQGTGRNAYINNYRVGGKTGTAQKVNNGVYMENNYILSFIGFMPADDPEVIVYVAIDNPKGVVQYGGTVAAPVAKNVLTSCIDILGIEKGKGDLERVYELWDTKYYEVPDVTGKTLKEAKNMLYPNFQIEYSGTGEKIIHQSPTSGEYVKSGGIVKVMLN